MGDTYTENIVHALVLLFSLSTVWIFGIKLNVSDLISLSTEPSLDLVIGCFGLFVCLFVLKTTYTEIMNANSSL